MACTDYDGHFIDALDAGTMAVRDAVLCPYQMSMGGVVFATLVVMGVINMPIYIRTQSVIIPFVVTTVLAGIVLSQTAAMMQGLVVVVALFVLGLGPVLVLKRIA